MLLERARSFHFFGSGQKTQGGGLVQMADDRHTVQYIPMSVMICISFFLLYICIDLSHLRDDIECSSLPILSFKLPC
jgi:hypothetical protein